MRQMIEIPPSKIKVGKFDQRLSKNDEEVVDLAASIKRIGVIEPLVVSCRAGVYHLIAGHRRLRASKEARLKKVPCIVEDRKMAVQSEVAIAENFFRRDMSPVEMAAMIVDYKKRMKLTLEKIAQILHKSLRWVQGIVAIADWPPDVQVAVHNHQITTNAASNLAVIGDKKYRVFLLRNAIEQGATARTTAAWLQEYKSRQPMEEAINAEPVSGRPPPQPATPHAPCFCCGCGFPANQMSHVPVCGDCIETMRTAGAASR